MADLPRLDGTCGVCVTRGDNHGTYEMAAECMNCGTKAVIIITKTHVHPGYNGGPNCPTCGTHNWHGWTLPADPEAVES